MSDPPAVAVGPIRRYLRRGPRWARRALVLTVAVGFTTQAAVAVSGIIVARALGVTDRGHLALLAVVAGALAFLGLFGVPAALTYSIARERPSARTLSRRLMSLAVAQAVVLVVLLAATLALIVGNDASNIKLAALITLGWMPAAVAYQYGLAILQAERRFGGFNVLRLLPVAMYAALALAIFLAGLSSVAAFAGGWTISYLVAGAAAVFLAARATRGADAPSSTTVRDLAAFGARSAIGQVSFAETFRVDQLVAGLFLGAAPLGLYAVAAAFTTLPMVIALSIGIVQYTHVAPQFDHEAGRRTVVHYLTLTLVLCTSIVLVLEAILPALLPWLFGEDFAPAVPAARILLLGGIAFAARRVLSDGLRALGRPTAGTYAELVSWAAFVPMLAVLTPVFGISGVAAAVTVSAFVGATFLGVSLARVSDAPADPTP